MQTPFILLYTIITYVVIVKLVSHSRLHGAHNVHLRKILKMFLDPAMLSIQQQIYFIGASVRVDIFGSV